jgi:sterol desaturase/sphingolipid hydroxylase (fatty acid hydroxylase superfamily)
MLQSRVILNIFTNELINYYVSSISIYMTTYWFFGFIYFWLDVLSIKYDGVKKLKIQNSKRIDFNAYYKTAKHVFAHQILSFPVILLTSPFLIYMNNDLSFTLPHMSTLLYHIILGTLYFDISFYTLHYLGHSKLIYGSIHKIHHEWTSPISIAAHYNHFLEHCIINTLLPNICMILTGANLITMLVWYFIGTLNAINTHSGYWFAWAKKHDNHHRYFTCNYGILITDYIFGTFRE